MCRSGSQSVDVGKCTCMTSSQVNEHAHQNSQAYQNLGGLMVERLPRLPETRGSTAIFRGRVKTVKTSGLKNWHSCGCPSSRLAS